MVFEANRASLSQHQVPDWFHDAKLGIFITWGLYSVPAYAPTEYGDINETFKRGGRFHFAHNPYAEWYLNSMKLEDGPCKPYHEQTYGADFSYDDISLTDLIHSFVDIVSKNGNLLLNVGPMADGTIPDLQLERLLGLGAWLDVNGDAIFGTRPWTRAEGTTKDGTPVRFTAKENALYAILLGRPAGQQIVLQDLPITAQSTIQMLGSAETLSWNQEGSNVRIALPHEIPDLCAIVFRITQD